MREFDYVLMDFAQSGFDAIEKARVQVVSHFAWPANAGSYDVKLLKFEHSGSVVRFTIYRDITRGKYTCTPVTTG